MAQIYIVNHAISGGSYAQTFSSYHHTEVEAQDSYDECMDSVGEDPVMIELVRLDTETLESTTIHTFEGSMDDLGDGRFGEDED